MADISSITLPNGGQYNFKDAASRSYISKAVIVEEIPTVSSLPLTIQNGSISSEHVVLSYYLSNDSAQLNEWEVTTRDGSFTISGNISGSTFMRIIFGLPYA